MDNNIGESWPSRRELADRYGLAAKTVAQWASKTTGLRYAPMGRRLVDSYRRYRALWGAVVESAAYDPRVRQQYELTISKNVLGK